MALKGPGKLLTTPHDNPAGKTLKNSPYGKLPDKSKKKHKKNEPSEKDSKQTETPATSGVSLKEVFTLIADENGRITSAKLRGFVKELDLDFSEEEIKEMIEVVDPSGKGDISYSNLVGIVRDFSHEFPNVQLNQEDLNRELTSESLPSNKEENKSQEPSSVEQNSDKNSADKIEETKQEEQKVSRPMSSKARIAETAKRIIDELDDKMSVIKEDDEPENDNEETNVENKTENVSEKENEQETDNGGERSEDTLKANDEDKEIVISEDNKSLISTNVAVIVPSLDKDDDNATEGDITKVEYTKELYTEECEDGDERMLTSQSRASIVKEHRLDSGISTAVGRMKEVDKDSEIGRRSRKSSTSEASQKSRRDSVKSHSRERSNSRSNRLDTRRKSVPRKKFHSMNDPEFYSTMGCSLKLSQIRTRQRLLYIMWRAVYDQAIRKMQEEQYKQQNQKKKKMKNVKLDPSLKTV